MKLMIDTNIILDAMMEREPWAKAAQNIMLAIAEDKAEGYITASTITDIYYFLRKRFNNRSKIKQTLISLLSLVKVLDVNGADCEMAFDMPMPDYEDALLACCGKRHKMDRIVTRDLKHFIGSPIKASIPEDIHLTHA